MSATASPTEELTFMFARIVDEKLVEYPDYQTFKYGGPGDKFKNFMKPIKKSYPQTEWIVLVPETPILYAPLRSLWERVAARPPVEFETGYWRNWEAGPPPVTLPPEDSDYISIFLVPILDYEKLNEERDTLTELRVSNISKHPIKSPSSGASPHEFVKDQDSSPIAMGRPKKDDFYHVPISLLHPAFAQFKHDLVSGPFEQDLSPLAHKWFRELSRFFADEQQRESAFHQLLSELLDGFGVSKKSISNYETDGGIDPRTFPDLLVKPVLVGIKNESTTGNSDAIFEIVLSDQEGLRVILTDDRYKGDWRKTRLPSVLIIHNGPNVQALGAVYLAEQYVEVLSPSLPLYFSEYDTRSMENLLRFMTALRCLFRSLCEVYEHPNDHAVIPGQVDFPYPSSYETFSGDTVKFTYIERADPIRLVFTACTNDNQNIIIKFGYGRYGVEAHRAAVEAGLAPALLGHTELTGGWWMVAMAILEDSYTPCDEIKKLEQPCKDAINKSVRKFHSLGFVHGDLRDTNVFVRECEGRWECQFIDFDWAGREGEVVYPVGVYNTGAVWRPERFLDGKAITFEHDRNTVDEFLRHTRF